MTTSADLGIPFVANQQSEPEITHNEALVMIQALLNGVVDRAVNAPPVGPTEGDSYIVGAAPTGAWDGHANQIAVWAGVGDGAAWRFVPGKDNDGSIIPIGARHEGMSVYVRDEDVRYVWTGAAWTAVSAGAFQFLGMVTLTGATATLPNLGNSDVKALVLMILNAAPATDDVAMLLRYDVGGVQNTNYQTSGERNSGGSVAPFNNTSAIQLTAAGGTQGMGSAANENATIFVFIGNPHDATVYKRATALSSWGRALDGHNNSGYSGGTWAGGTDALEGLELSMSSGDLNGGVALLFGIK